MKEEGHKALAGTEEQESPETAEDELAADPDPAAVVYSTTDFDIEGLVRRLQRGDIVIPTFGEDVEDPPIETARFQRPLVWTKSQMDRFIESLLLGYPIPGIFLVNQSDNRYLVLDGQQRLRTLRAFTEGIVYKREFALSNVAERFKGLTYKGMSPQQRRQLENTFIQATIVQATPADGSLDAIYQVFERLNAGGTQLTPHEIRIALYAGPFVEWLTRISTSSEWRNLYGVAPRHLRDQELILRILALSVEPDSYKRPLKKYLNDFTSKYRTLESLENVELEERFLTAAKLLLGAEGSSVLRPAGSAVNAAWTEAIFVGLMRRLAIRPIDVEEVRAALQQLRANKDLAEVTARATADLDSVQSRVRIASEAFMGA